MKATNTPVRELLSEQYVRTRCGIIRTSAQRRDRRSFLCRDCKVVESYGSTARTRNAS